MPRLVRGLKQSLTTAVIRGKKRKNGIVETDTRHYISKLASGRVLLIYNAHPQNRTNMTIALSEDDGATWKYQKIFDTRQFITYLDAQEKDGVIYMTYDYKRISEREILFANLPRTI